MTRPDIIHTLGLLIICAVPVVIGFALLLGLCKTAADKLIPDDIDDGRAYSGDDIK